MNDLRRSKPGAAMSVRDPIDMVPRTLGERCVDWCLEEAAQHPFPSPERTAWYHAIAVRDGKPLGIKKGVYCASAQCRALLECLLPGEPTPHELRAAATELQHDAAVRGHWHSIVEVRRGRWLPSPGDLAIYDRFNLADPSTSWQRHVDRVIQLSRDLKQYESIGPNELAGAWRRQWIAFDAPRLLGFVAYPGLPVVERERERAHPATLAHLAG